MKKIFVLDTNILLADPNSIYKFDDNDIVIPISVIEEIDNFKKVQSEIGRNAREVSRVLDKLRELGNLSAGVPLFKGRNDALLSVYLGHDLTVLPRLLDDKTDNRILSVALNLQKKVGSEKKVILITKDSNLRIKSDSLGVSSEDFAADKVNIQEMYSGVLELEVGATCLNELYTKGQTEVPYDHKVHANQFLVLKNRNNPENQISAYYDASKERIISLKLSHEKVWGITPRNTKQLLGLWALLNDDIKLVTLTGGAGTGKTLLAIASALAKTTDDDAFNKTLIARPIFPLGKDIGYLPGDIDEKLNPWMQPIFDNLELLLNGEKSTRNKRANKSYNELINQGLLSVEPLTYIRGRSLPHCYFLVDEAQNLTPHEIKTIITRVGEGSKIVLTGDPFQIDNPYIDATNNGLTHVVERFKGSDISAHVTFDKGERSKLATLAAEYL